MFACLCVCLFLAMHYIYLPTCHICLLPCYIYLPLCVSVWSLLFVIYTHLPICSSPIVCPAGAYGAGWNAPYPNHPAGGYPMPAMPGGYNPYNPYMQYQHQPPAYGQGYPQQQGAPPYPMAPQAGYPGQQQPPYPQQGYQGYPRAPATYPQQQQPY